ncbi:MAG: hypothetical protein P8Z80_17505, partial [Pseudolabrys sp.]
MREVASAVFGQRAQPIPGPRIELAGRENLRELGIGQIEYVPGRHVVEIASQHRFREHCGGPHSAIVVAAMVVASARRRRLVRAGLRDAEHAAHPADHATHNAANCGADDAADGTGNLVALVKAVDGSTGSAALRARRGGQRQRGEDEAGGQSFPHEPEPLAIALTTMNHRCDMDAMPREKSAALVTGSRIIPKTGASSGA